jgi:hypothetical protein
LHGSLNRFLLAPCDLASNSFRRPLHGLGRHFQTSQQLDLTACVVERRFRANQRQHTAHTGRQIQLFYVQSGIGGKLPVMTLRTQIPRALKLDFAHGGEHSPRTHFAITGFLSAGAGYFALFRAGRMALQQRAQRDRSGMMHGCPHGHLDRFQIEPARLAPLLKDEPQQRTYFACDFLLDRFRRFFSCCVKVSSSGLTRQIFSLTSTRSRLSSRKR